MVGERKKKVCMKCLNGNLACVVLRLGYLSTGPRFKHLLKLLLINTGVFKYK